MQIVSCLFRSRLRWTQKVVSGCAYDYLLSRLPVSRSATNYEKNYQTQHRDEQNQITAESQAHVTAPAFWIQELRHVRGIDVLIVTQCIKCFAQFDNVLSAWTHFRSPNTLVRETYRVLLTRGIKECFVFLEDKETENFFRSRIETVPVA
jgi:Uncharacterized conserved protein (DUF2075)